MDFVLPEPVSAALSRLQKAGYAAYVVGGCVRDHVLNITPHDYDICTSAVPREMQEVFAGERTIETGLQHGTLTVLLSGMPLEITTFRVDGAYLDGRHPSSVSFTRRLEDDLSRRDFTINAMAYSPEAGLVDPFGGQEDCARGLVRCVGCPESRFEEDALRILRALRFSARLRFPIEEKTAAAIHREKGRLEKISRERIAAELGGLLLGGGAEEILLQFSDVLEAAVPQLSSLIHSGRWPLALARLSRAPVDLTVRWAALLMDCAEDPQAASQLSQSILRNLKMPVRTIDRVSLLALWKNAPLSLSSLQEMLVHLGPEALGQLILLRQAEEAARQAPFPLDAPALLREADRLLQENACCTLAQLAVNGQDMAKLGFQGPAIGETLRSLLLRVARGQLPNERQALLDAVK